MSKLGFKIKQKIKSNIQNVYLPGLYKRYASKCQVNEKRVIIADMHSDKIPFSMEQIYNTLVAKGYSPIVMCKDIAKMSYPQLLKFLKGFMKEYAAAGYVYICSYFLPVSSCKKRKETKVIQLWHSGGLLKKMGYDTKDDIPRDYKGDVTANYDLVTVSAEVCETVWEKALRLPAGTAKATGLARTDVYFNEEWNAGKIESFYKTFPEAKGKKVVLYAPSFSGNAAEPKCEGIKSDIKSVMKKFSEEYFFLVKLHPHLRGAYPEYEDERMSQFSTEDILPVTSILITDYSSVLFDYAIYKKPFILFCPDYESYKRERGFYTDIKSFPAPFATDTRKLEEIFREKMFFDYDEEEYEEFCKKYMGACDGKCSDRIVDMVAKL